MKLRDFKALTFDCYGTLIDWETGLYTALQPLLQKSGITLKRDEVLAAFARHESAQQVATPAMIYSELLAEVHRLLAHEWNVSDAETDAVAFGKSVPDWPAFPDTQASLQYLQRYYKLVILSNVDRESFAGSNRQLGVAFDAICTAQDIGSYKPDPRNFAYLINTVAGLGVLKRNILHTAQSLHHDHVPAQAAGLSTAWIDRRHQLEGWGATSPPAGTPRYDFRFTSLGEMVKAHQGELKGA
jgi:2-haloacid dehalogenase